MAPEAGEPDAGSVITAEVEEVRQAEARTDAAEAWRQLESWAAPLQQACQLETDKGFNDLRGRRETFAQFLCRCLSDPPSRLAEKDREALRGQGRRFRDYADLAPDRRRQLVVALRQELHGLCRRHRPPAPPPGPPRWP